ncbi:HD-GYP domain-containing protein [Roseateles cellulosilyticus]|uniref:HD-GYP domain-containing protein n=1 Tax=Pelomonas cellulosilytica TaxID=2906762 RepID=A0ABS8XVS7_9BURK|nr:HD-GYP domain-containing protein [Pelomonas sp. P8]MCE4556742.1 HD-GYP domain-containing protein [Pelomonas sp. P8]
MERIVVDLRRMYCERNEALREVTRAHHEALLRLALAADFRDDDTGVHMARIGYLAEALALQLGEPAAFAAMLRRAAPMHDVGKIGIPDGILKKPGTYTAEERAVMNGHAEMGAHILGRSRVPLFHLAADVALTHHERWDGSGYPHKLTGEAIPLCGRIVAVVDFFDALTMDRCYRKAFTDDVALGMLAEQCGKAFDPRIAQAFIDNAAAMIELRDRINRHPPSFDELAALD